MAGRPREFDRDAALAKARDAFWSRGYEGVSITDLVETLGLASARIYAAFGSKEKLFQEAVALYDEGEGGFATRALAEEPTAARAIERSLREAVETYTRKDRPQGCMVVSAATNCAAENDGVREFLADLKVSVPVSKVAKWKTTAQLFALGFLIAGPAGDKVLPGNTQIGIVLLWAAAGLTIYTGWDYFNAGIRHLVEQDERMP